MPDTVTLKGQSFTLKGELVKTGQRAPECTLTGVDLKPVKLSSYRGKGLLLMSVPSLDTPTCSQEGHRFNQEMDQFKDSLNAVVVSMDLPFAQARWCGAEGIKNLVTLSDYKTHEFGERYGLRIQELGLLARAVLLIDARGEVHYVHLVKEVSQEPNYKEILEQVQQFIAHK